MQFIKAVIQFATHEMVSALRAASRSAQERYVTLELLLEIREVFLSMAVVSLELVLESDLDRQTVVLSCSCTTLSCHNKDLTDMYRSPNLYAKPVRRLP